MLWSQSIWICFSILIRSTIIIIVKLNHHLCIIFTTHHMINLELDMNYMYYMNSNSIFWIHFMFISNHSTFQALARSSQTKPCLICIMCLSHYVWCPAPYAYKYLHVSCKHRTLPQIQIKCENVRYIVLFRLFDILL